MSGLLIIGSGHAGLTLAREWRKRDPDSALTIVTADDGAAYYKPNLSKALASGKTADELIMTPASKLATDLAADMRTHTRVARIDAAAHSVVLENGESLDYAQLVLAHGAECRKFPWEGDAVDQILHVNDRLDYAHFREKLPAEGHVLLIGAGLIGCEYANDLLSQGYKVTLVDPLGWPLGMLLPEVVGGSLQSALTDAGATFELGTTVTAVNAADSGYAVTLADGRVLQADLVLSAVGLVPRTELAQSAGIDCGRGVRVDAQLQTSVPDVYALGDVAEVCGHVLPYILPITASARALAATLTGEPTAVNWPAMPVIVKTPVLPTLVCPPPRVDGEWQTEGEAPNWIARFVAADGEVLGFAATGTATKERGSLAKETAPPKLA